MRQAVKQANFLLPVELLDDLKATVAAREQSKIVAEALRRELKRIHLAKALQSSFGAWESEKHPELNKGIPAFVRSSRKSSRTSRSK